MNNDTVEFIYVSSKFTSTAVHYLSQRTIMAGKIVPVKQQGINILK